MDVKDCVGNGWKGVSKESPEESMEFRIKMMKGFGMKLMLENGGRNILHICMFNIWYWEVGLNCSRKRKWKNVWLLTNRM